MRRQNESDRAALREMLVAMGMATSKLSDPTQGAYDLAALACATTGGRDGPVRPTVIDLEAARLWAHGLRVKDIARELSVQPSLVERMVRRGGWPRHTTKGQMSRSDRAARLRAAGVSP